MLLHNQSGRFSLGELGGGDVGWRSRERRGVLSDVIVALSTESNGLAITVRSKAKKGPKEVPPIIPHRELLSKIRSRKKLSWLLREQELSQENSGAEKVFPFWRKKSKAELEARAFTRRIMQLSQRQQLDQEMLMPGNCGVDNVTYGILLKGLGQARRLDDAFELAEAIEAGTAPGRPVLSDIHLNTLVNACVEAGDSLRARGVLLRYRSSAQGLKPSVLTYNLLIKGCARSDSPLDALKLKEEMLLLKLQPQRVTYNTLIFACVRGGNMEKAFKLFEEMKLAARKTNNPLLLPDVVTHTTLLKGLADDSDIESVSRLVSEMQSSPGCVFDRVAYTAIIDAFIRAGSPTEGLRFFEQEMQVRAKVDSKFRPKTHVYLSLMRAFAAKGDLDIVSSLRQQMVPGSAGKKSVEDRAEADELMIETAVNAGQLGVAQKVLRTMIGIKKGIPLSQRAHLVIVRLQAMLGFSQDLFNPILLKPGLSPYDTVESIMSPYDMTRPLPGDVQLKSVIMRFFKQDALPVVDDQGKCIGVVHSEDCFQMHARLCDIMRPPPPEVTDSTLAMRAVSLLLETQVKMVVVVSSKATYSTKSSSSREVPLGFITRETIFRGNDFLLPTD